MMPGMEMRIYALVLLFAAAVGIKGDITEAAAGAEAIFYLVEAVYRRPHGMCAVRVLSLTWRRRGVAQE